MNSVSMSASLLVFNFFKMMTTIAIENARARRLISKNVAATAPLLSQNCVAEDVVTEDEDPVEEGSTNDSTVVDVEESSTPILKVVLGVTSGIGEYDVVVEEADVETADEVEITIVGADDVGRGLAVELVSVELVKVELVVVMDVVEEIMDVDDKLIDEFKDVDTDFEGEASRKPSVMLMGESDDTFLPPGAVEFSRSLRE